jgi:gliding motility-associated-like protein
MDSFSLPAVKNKSEMLRFFTVCFFLLFLGNAYGQSWDWVSYWTNVRAVNNNGIYTSAKGTTYALNFSWYQPVDTSRIYSTADSSIYSSDELIFRFDANGHRKAGSGINFLLAEGAAIRLITGYRDSLYALVTSSVDVVIAGTVFKGSRDTLPIILVRLTSDCKPVKATQIGTEYSTGDDFFKIQFHSDEEGNFSILVPRPSYWIRFGAFTVGADDDWKNLRTYILNFDRTGHLRWQKTLAGCGEFSRISPLFIDGQAHVWTVLSRYVTNTVYIGDTIIEFDRNGTFLQSASTRGNGFINSLFIDKQQNLYICGTFWNSVELPGNILIPGGAISHGLLVKFDRNLKVLWTKITNRSESSITCSAADTLDNVYIPGENFDSAAVSFAGFKIKKDYTNIFFVKTDKNGDGQWLDYVKEGTDIQDIRKDDCDNIYFIGYFYNEYPNPHDTARNTWIGDLQIKEDKDRSEVFIAKLNPDRLSFRLNEACEQKTLENTSDSSKYVSFEWILPDGSTDTSRTISFPNIKYPKPFYIGLKGTKRGGCTNTTTRQVWPIYTHPPKVSFHASPDTGCQWTKTYFYDDSKADTALAGKEKWLWDFGDGSAPDTLKNPVHIYQKSGVFTVWFKYYSGLCEDTFSRLVAVRPAPRPGFSISRNNGCAPLTVNVKPLYADSIIHYRYESGDGASSSDGAPSFIYTKPGKYILRQYLSGPRGCITEDSAIITVKDGFAIDSRLNMLRADVGDDQKITVSWQGDRHALSYQLYRGEDTAFRFYKITKDTFFTDSAADASRDSYSYYVTAGDSCGNNTIASNLARNILLEIKDQSAEELTLGWSPYVQWVSGVDHYGLYILDDTTFSLVADLNNNTTGYTDKELIRQGRDKLCFRLEATEKGGNRQTSRSNILCVPALPMVWIPDAFTPDANGLNESFSPVCTAISGFQFVIYNRWGEKVFESSPDKPAWDGSYRNSPAAAGIYLYSLTAKGKNGQNFFRKGTVQLVR